MKGGGGGKGCIPSPKTLTNRQLELPLPSRITGKSTGLLWHPADQLRHIRGGTQAAHSSRHRARWLHHRAQARGA